MTTQTISTYFLGGYVLAARFDTLDITATGWIQANNAIGVQLNHPSTLINDGRINSYANGVDATAATLIDNDASGRIDGYSGVFAQNAATTVVNNGAITGRNLYGEGVFLTAGGAVTNGSGPHSTASILGGNCGVDVGGTAVVQNYGTIKGGQAQGVEISQGGAVRNKTYAYIYGGRGAAVRIDGASGQVSNDGDIYSIKSEGVDLQAGGVVSNSQHGVIRTSRYATYAAGVYGAGAATTVTNSGKIDSILYSGVELRAGGTVTNTGAILGAAGNFGVIISGAGVVTNGSPANAAALIQGAVYLQTSGQVNNFGTIEGGGLTGVYIKSGSVTNGAATDTAALIDGYYVGVRTGANVTITNFGTIEGAGGFAPRAVDLGPSSMLIVEAGCAFIGQVRGDGGTLDLAGGVGVLGLLPGETVSVTGSMALTTFNAFGVVEVAAGATFSTAGKAVVSTGQSLIDSGRLILGDKGHAVANAGTIEVLGGTLTLAGKVTGQGVDVINGGLLDAASTFKQKVTFAGAGAGVLELANSRSYSATVTGFSKIGESSLDLDDIGFVGAGEAAFKGNSQRGVLTITDGAHTAHIKLTGDYRFSNFVASSDGRGGTSVTASAAETPGERPAHAFIAAMAAFHATASDLGPPAPTRLETSPTLLYRA